jgi:hypothetical protein
MAQQTTHTEMSPHHEEQAEYPYQPSSGPLAEINQDFHDSYELLVQRTLEQLGQAGQPVMIMRGDQLILLHDGQREEADVVPNMYHQLKAVSHVPLGLYTFFIAIGPDLLSKDEVSELEQKSRLIQIALDGLEKEDFPAEFEAKQVMILRSCQQLMDTVIKSKRVDEQSLTAYTQVVASLLLDNANLAVKLQLDSVHQQVAAWRATMDEAEWTALKVIICAGHQTRSGEATKQYFDKLLGQRKGTGAEREERVIYAESLSTVSSVLDLLARHMVDQLASTAFFRSRLHLQQDLLANSAAEYIQTLLAE